MKYSIIITTAMTLALTGQFVSAGSIPDEYSTGDPLTAVKMNAIRTAVNDNDGKVTANTAGIAASATAIAGNATNIGNNTTEIGNNATAIGNNTTDIGDNTTAIGDNTAEIAINTLGIAALESSNQKHVMLCGTSARNVTIFVPAYPAIQLVTGCSPATDTLAMLVARSGEPDVDAVELQAYLNAGGIVVGEWSINDELYNKAFNTAEVEGASTTGGCMDYVMPDVQYNSFDPLWIGVDFIPASSTGCGKDMQLWTDVVNSNITKLGGWASVAGSVSLAYRNLGPGRLWLVEHDWQDSQSVNDYESSRQLMRYMLSHK